MIRFPGAPGPGRRSPLPGARELLAAAALLGLFAGVFLYADPRGPFCLNDDFMFSGAVRRLLVSGRLQLSQWSLPANITHILFGAVAGFLTSPSNQNLRFANILLGAVCVLLFFFFLIDLGLSPGRAGAGAGVLAANPIYLAMSGSFHSDVCSLFLEIAFLWAFLAALRRRSAAGLAVSSALIALAALNRQTFILAIAGMAAVLLPEKWRRPGHWAALFAPAGSIFSAYILWFCLIHGRTWAWRPHAAFFSLLNPAAWLTPKVWTDRLLLFNAAAQELAVFLFPIAVGAAASLRRLPRPGRRQWGVLIFSGILAGAGCWRIGGLPVTGNTWLRLGLGAVTLSASFDKAAGLWAAPWVWRGLGALGLLSCLALIRVLFSISAASGKKAWAVLWPVLPPVLILLLAPIFYDRYLLTLLPALIAVLLLALEERPFSLALCTAGCLLWASASAIGLRDYYSWNRARWRAGLYGVRLGVPPSRIENGFDWDGQYSLEKNMAELLAKKPARSIGLWDWMKENKVLMETSFSARPPAPGFESIAEFGYDTPLSPRREFVYLYGDRRAFRRR